MHRAHQIETADADVVTMIEITQIIALVGLVGGFTLILMKLISDSGFFHDDNTGNTPKNLQM